MHWILLAVGLVGTGAFCWYVLREDRRSMRLHEARRDRLRLVPGGRADDEEAAGVAVDTRGDQGRRAA